MIRFNVKLILFVFIIGLIIAIYLGFRYMSNQLEKAREEATILQIQNSELQNTIESKDNISQINITQTEHLIQNTKDALNNTADYAVKIDSYTLSGDRKEMLKKINDYERCMSINSLKPSIKCDLDL